MSRRNLVAVLSFLQYAVPVLIVSPVIKVV